MFLGILLMVARNSTLDCISDFSISSFSIVDRLSVIYMSSIFFLFFEYLCLLY